MGAVSLTYDDGHPTCLDQGIPDLQKYGFRGTFFVTPGINDVERRAADWRGAARRGHEIANHTFDHPCGDSLHGYTVEQFTKEQTGKTEQWLNEHIGFDDERTYAYTCGETFLGSGPGAHDRYRDLVAKTFLAARGGGGGPATPKAVRDNAYEISASAATWGNDDHRPAIDYCSQALASRGWAVLIFHNLVTGEASAEIETSRYVHEEVLRWLNERRRSIWIQPFREVYRHIVRHGAS
jgi:peptidoglycan/xylan/chitin deacetylase (PgdA/CDA1 family)